MADCAILPMSNLDGSRLTEALKQVKAGKIDLDAATKGATG